MIQRKPVKALKYQFNKPRNSAEHVEALYEELAEGEEKTSSVSRKTLKGYVIEMVEHMRARTRGKRAKKAEEESEFWQALIVLGLALAVLFFLGIQDGSGWGWLDEKRFVFKVCGTLLGFVFVLVQIERMAFFKVLWKFGFTKFIVSVGATALLVFSTGKAAGVINGVFGIDATALPLSLTFMTGFIFFKYLSPVIALIGLLAVVHVISIVVWVKTILKGGYPTGPLASSTCFFLVSCVVMGFYWGWGGNRLSDERLPELAYKLAHVLDFNSKHTCANVPANDAVVFIGSSQNVVLTDPNRIQIESLQAFFEEDLYVPASFAREACALPQSPRRADASAGF